MRDGDNLIYRVTFHHSQAGRYSMYLPEEIED